MKSYKRKIAALLTTVLTLTLLFSCSSEGKVDPNYDLKLDLTKENSDVSGPLWKIEDEDSVVYLHGTIHLGDKNIYPLHKDVEEAFKNSDYLVLEAVFDELDAKKIQEASSYPNGETIEDHLSKDSVRIVKDICAENGLMYDVIKYWTPFTVYRTLIDYKMKNETFDPTYGIDNYWLYRARLGKKDVLALDDYYEVYKTLGELSDEDGEILIQSLKFVKEDGTGDADKSMWEAWKSGDLDKMFAVEEDLSAYTPEELEAYNNVANISGQYDDALLNDRNAIWADTIKGYLDDNKDYFVAGGTAHFYGEGSVIELLEKKGLTVTRVR